MSPTRISAIPSLGFLGFKVSVTCVEPRVTNVKALVNWLSDFSVGMPENRDESEVPCMELFFFRLVGRLSGPPV